MVQNVQLTTERDGIKWNLTGDGHYTTKSAYHVQFLARIPQPRLEQIWRAKAEPRVKFYMWLLLRNRNWTSDRLQNMGLIHSPKCILCDQIMETAVHITLQCPFAQEVWHSFVGIHVSMAHTAQSAQTINKWWNRLQGGTSTQAIRSQVTMAMYIAWHIWKERNARTFENTSTTPSTVAAKAKADVSLFTRAMRM